ncbi:MAG: 1-deoxy-D-xylulose-5-phosphate reductoisomerase [Clostridia bacterium]|nr:1-deoxy-D-xylulose-5-phosphate reductoisomerase [Clostridia bacterium]
MIKISLIGSTGSIGRQVVDVALRHKDKFKIITLAAGGNAKLLEEQANLLHPEVIALADPEKACEIKELPKGTALYTGENAVLHAVSEKSDIVFVAVSGFAGLKPTLEGISLGKDIALANKETLVAGGEIVMKLAKEKGVRIIPVDSEHSAIFQCLGFKRDADFRKLIITASGGAFRDLPKEKIEKMNAADALRHPNWNMGKKITIDCATLLNKGLEVIEACRLYNAPLEKVEAIIHPESIIHSMVEFCDGAIMAQLGYPSMEIPIQLALTYPKRYETGVPFLSLAGKTLHFDNIDTDRFPCFSLALDAYKKGGLYPCAMNAANEAAVMLYLEDKIKFYDIAELISYATEKAQNGEVTYDNLVFADAEARRAVQKKAECEN